MTAEKKEEAGTGEDGTAAEEEVPLEKEVLSGTVDMEVRGGGAADWWRRCSGSMAGMIAMEAKQARQGRSCEARDQSFFFEERK